MSFSFLGVAFIVVVGSVIIIIESQIEAIADLIWPYLRHRDDQQIGQYCRKAWTLDNDFQVQRKEFEGLSQGDWEHDDEKTISHTVTGEKLEYFHNDAPGPTRNEIYTR
jgi:hypothetical protein